MTYKDTPVFGKTNNGDQEFYTVWSHLPTETVVALKELDTNWVLEGEIQISKRVGKSEHGEQLIICFGRKLYTEQMGRLTKEPRNSDSQTIEMYLPLEFGLKFLKDTIAYLEKGEKPNG